MALLRLAIISALVLLQTRSTSAFRELMKTNGSNAAVLSTDTQRKTGGGGRSAGGLETQCDTKEALLGFKDEDYRGCQTQTKSGWTCQKWTSQSPHDHSLTPSKRPGKGLGNHNYCRNPDGESTIWCYTTDPSKRWETCRPLIAPATVRLHTCDLRNAGTDDDISVSFDGGNSWHNLDNRHDNFENDRWDTFPMPSDARQMSLKALGNDGWCLDKLEISGMKLVPNKGSVSSRGNILVEQDGVWLDNPCDDVVRITPQGQHLYCEGRTCRSCKTTWTWTWESTD